MSILIFLSTLIVLIVMGMPIAFALMLTGVALMVQLNFFDAQLVAQNMIAGADIYPLMAVPCFILAGELMNAGGISKRIINLAVSMVGHIQGGLGYVAIAATLLLGCFSGSALADTAAVATLLIPMMRDNGYPVPRSAGLIAAGGVIAPIVPPSMPCIMCGVTTNTSCGAGASSTANSPSSRAWSTSISRDREWHTCTSTLRSLSPKTIEADAKSRRSRTAFCKCASKLPCAFSTK